MIENEGSLRPLHPTDAWTTSDETTLSRARTLLAQTTTGALRTSLQDALQVAFADPQTGGARAASAGATPTAAFVAPRRLHRFAPDRRFDPARAVAPADTLGPLLTPTGRPEFIHHFIGSDRVGVAVDAAPPSFFVPLDFHGALTAGTIWFRAALFIAGVDSDQFVGFKIRGGDLLFSIPPKRHGSTLTIESGCVCTLDLELGSSTPPATAAPPGEDGARTSIEAPNRVRIQIDADHATLISSGDVSIATLGWAGAARWAGGEVTLSHDLGAVCFDFVPSVDLFEVREMRSTFLEVEGRAPITRAGWALPIAKGDSATFGEALDAGSVFVATGVGLSCRWEGSPRSDGRFSSSLIAAGAGSLSFFGFELRAPTFHQVFRLWHEGDVRRSKVTLRHPTRVFFGSTPGSELLVFRSDVDFDADRPVDVTGARVSIDGSGNTFLERTSGGTTLLIEGFRESASTPVAMALTNALLTMTSSTGFELFGNVSDDIVTKGGFVVGFGVRSLLPTLPDPYVSTDELPMRQPSVSEWLLALVQFEDHPELALALVGPPGGSDTTAVADVPGRSYRHRSLLVDVSTNVDQLGVGFGVTNTRELHVRSLTLETLARNVELMTLPAISWEPVHTIQNPSTAVFPDPFALPNDGPPTAIGTNTVHLTPLHPRGALERVVQDFALDSRDPDFDAHARLTLPFGLVAIVDLVAREVALRRVEPKFRNALDGGHQLRIERGLHATSDALPGSITQTGTDVPGRGPTTILDTQVTTIFNAELAPTGSNPRVPLLRYDVSGYGASLVSNWIAKGGVGPHVSQARFDVFVGRTAYEVVQVESLLYPWGVHVVRTITIERNGGGSVFRRDSGWLATSTGRYDLGGLIVHPGAVRELIAVRNIRDTPRTFITKDGAELAAVYFDADVVLDGTIVGASRLLKIAVDDEVAFVADSRLRAASVSVVVGARRQAVSSNSFDILERLYAAATKYAAIWFAPNPM